MIYHSSYLTGEASSTKLCLFALPRASVKGTISWCRGDSVSGVRSKLPRWCFLSVVVVSEFRKKVRAG